MLFKSNSKSIIKKINNIKAKRINDVYKYFYLLMVELNESGIALSNVGEKNFIQSNWKMMRGKYRTIILQIHEWYNNDEDEFEKLFLSLSDLIIDNDFRKWAKTPWFRFLFIKSLHDASINTLKFNTGENLLTLNVNSKNAIDLIPFDNVIELSFETKDFELESINDLASYFENNESIIWGITTYFKDKELRVNIDYDCYYDNTVEKVNLPELDFICSNLIISNHKSD